MQAISVPLNKGGSRSEWDLTRASESQGALPSPGASYSQSVTPQPQTGLRALRTQQLRPPSPSLPVSGLAFSTHLPPPHTATWLPSPLLSLTLRLLLFPNASWRWAHPTWPWLPHLDHGSTNYFCKGQESKVFSALWPRWSVTPPTLLQGKPAKGLHGNGHGYAPIKLYLQEQAAGPWSMP